MRDCNYVQVSKKICIAFIVLCALLFLLVMSYKNLGYVKRQNTSGVKLYGVVTEKNTGSFIIRSAENDSEYRISLDTAEQFIETEEIAVGTKLCVTHNGQIMEIAPAMFSEIYDLEIVS